MDAPRNKIKASHRWIILKDGKPVSGEMYLGGAQVCLFLMKQFSPEHNWSFKEIIIDPFPKLPKPLE